MQFGYVGTKVHYNFKKNEEKEVLVLLHGWGGTSKLFKGLSMLKKNFSVLEIDFPPFGKSEEPKNWNVFSYANMVISLCEHLGIEKAYFLGHSFGGRIAILVSVIKRTLVQKLVLVDSAGMKPKRKMSYFFKVSKIRFMKLMGLEVSHLGSEDYKRLSLNMKKTFNSIVTTHLEEYASLIESPTLIVFGSDDKETPIYMAQRLNKLIKGSELVIMKDCGHFCFLDKPYKFCKLTSSFLKGEK